MQGAWRVHESALALLTRSVDWLDSGPAQRIVADLERRRNGPGRRRPACVEVVGPSDGQRATCSITCAMRRSGSAPAVTGQREALNFAAQPRLS